MVDADMRRVQEVPLSEIQTRAAAAEVARLRY